MGLIAAHPLSSVVKCGDLLLKNTEISQRISFLIGSGASISAGMPRITEITERVVSGLDVMRHTDGNYYFGQPLYAHAGFHDEYVPRVIGFLKRLSTEVERYYSLNNERQVNYEDLYYVAAQIRDSELGEYDNPVVQAFIDKIIPDIQPLLIGQKNEIRGRWQLHEIAEEATNYIHDIVWHLLSKEATSLDYLLCIKDAFQDSETSGMDIFTLNHDTVMETYLSGERINYTDGFGEPVNNVRYWAPDLYENTSFTVRLFKLHGSVNWFLFPPHEGTLINEPVGIPLDGDFWHTKNPNGEMQLPVHGRPMLLAGTFNKMLQYTSGIYADLYYQFYQILRHTRKLMICGYGFGDKGVNTRVVEWVYSSPDNKIIIIHPHPEKLKRMARGAISNNWDNWLHKSKLFIISKTIEETSWEEIKYCFA